jgi:hypothetical protein
VIFLDIDGVLNPETVDRFNELVADTHALLVLSSARRRDTDHARELLERIGVHGRVLGVTPLLEDCSRGREIALWLKAARMHRYAVESFVILDDRSDMGDLANHLVQIDPRVGLQPADVVAATELLLLDTALARRS